MDIELNVVSKAGIMIRFGETRGKSGKPYVHVSRYVARSHDKCISWYVWSGRADERSCLTRNCAVNGDVSTGL